MLDLQDKIKVLQKVTDKNNPNLALNHVYVDDEYMVAINKDTLLALPRYINVKNPMLIVNHKAKTPLIVEGYLRSIEVNYSVAKEYYDYKRVLNQASTFSQVEGKWRLSDFLYHLSHTKGWVMDYIGRAALLKHLNNKLGEIKAYHYSGNKKPLFLKFDKGAVLVIIPIVAYVDIDFSELCQ